MNSDSEQVSEQFAVPSHDPFASEEAQPGSFWPVMLRALVLMMMADDVLDPREQKVLTEIYGRSGLVLDERRLNLEIRAVEENKQDPVAYLNERSDSLSNDEKTQLIEAAFKVAYADEDFQEEERELLDRMAESLSISKETLGKITSELEAAREKNGS